MSGVDQGPFLGGESERTWRSPELAEFARNLPVHQTRTQLLGGPIALSPQLSRRTAEIGRQWGWSAARVISKRVALGTHINQAWQWSSNSLIAQLYCSQPPDVYA
ncbi:hypothetical protein ACU4GD_18115 [Cupriavidus basilensis]